MTKGYRYLQDKDRFLNFSYLALKEQFGSRNEFTAFFEAIKSDGQKNLFLKTASFYLFLVKKGDWLVDIPGYDRNIDYLTDTYKYIAIFSFIESLQENEFIDFYSFLGRCKSNVKFPIKDKKELDKWYREYKQEFGSVQKSIKFFNSLSSQKKDDLIENLEVKDAEPSIENLSKYLYNLRSKFVHEAELIVNMSEGTAISKYGGKFVICKMSLGKLMEIFEEGLVIFFTQ